MSFLKPPSIPIPDKPPMPPPFVSQPKPAKKPMTPSYLGTQATPTTVPGMERGKTLLGQ